jgi:hypothetical protein
VNSALNIGNERLFDLIPGTLNDTTQLNCLLLLQNDKTVLEIMLKKVTVMVDFKILNQYLEKKLKPWNNTGLYGRSPCRHPQAETFQIRRCINHWTTTFRCSELRTNEAKIRVLIFLSWLSVLQMRRRCRSDRYSRNRWYSSTVAEKVRQRHTQKAFDYYRNTRGIHCTH